MMCRRYIGKPLAVCLAILCFLIEVPNVSRAQCVNGMGGREFWLMFLESGDNYGNNSAYSIVAATSESTTITVENIAMYWSSTVAAEANSVVTIPLPANVARSYANGTVASVGLHVTSDQDIVLYASNFRDYSFDMTAVLPYGALDTVYMVQTLMEMYSGRLYLGMPNGQKAGEMVGIVATEDSTVVTMVTPCDVVSNQQVIYSAGDTIREMLMRGRTLQVSTAGGYIGWGVSFASLSGMRVETNGKPIAVFQGDRCPYVCTALEQHEPAISSCDHVYEQTVPMRFWGEKFVIVSTFGYISGSDVVEVTSSEDNCEVRLDGNVISTLAAGETKYIELWQYLPYSDTAIHAYLVETSKPSCVYLYTGCARATETLLDVEYSEAGDPSSVYIPPVEQGLSFSRFQTVNTPVTNRHYANIVARTTDTADVFCDGQPVRFTATDWGYCYANVEVPEGVHNIVSDHGRFQAFVYGRGDAECYAYVASMAMHDMQNVLLADGVDVRLMVDDIEKCVGDTTVFTLRSDSLNHEVEWLVDGLSTGVMDTVYNYVGSRRGWVRVDAVVDGMCDTLTAYVNVHSDTIHIDTAMCNGSPFVWGEYVFGQAGEYVERLAGETCRFLSVSLHLRETSAMEVEKEQDCSTGETTLSVTLESDDDVLLCWSSVPEGFVPEGMEHMDVIAVNPQQTIEYHVRVKLDDWCIVEENVTVVPMKLEKARLIVTPERLMPEDFSFTASDVSLGCDRREWLIDGRKMEEYGETLVYNVLDRGDSITVALVIWNGECSDTAYCVILVRSDKLWAPNVFTPAKDDNALFSIVTQGIEQTSLDIFDRKGLLVFHSDNPVEGWDGTNKGTFCPQGTYVWHLRYHVDTMPQSEKTATGTVTLLR